MHSKSHTLLHSLLSFVRLLVLLNLFELLLSVDHVRFVHDLVLAFAVNDLLESILGFIQVGLGKPLDAFFNRKIVVAHVLFVRALID